MALTATAAAAPVSNRNLHPIKHTYSAPPMRCCTMSPLRNADWLIEIQHDTANASYREQSGSELLLVDAEVNRTEVHAVYAWQHSTSNGGSENHNTLHRSNQQLGIAIPWISLSGGHTDSIISNWHDWFELPNGNRDNRPEDTLQLLYQRNGETLIDRSNAFSGVGDIDLYWQSTRVQRNSGATSQLQAGLTVPLHSRSTLISSDTVQLHGHWGWYSQALAGNSRFFGRLGARYSLNGGLLQEHRKDLTGFATLGIDLPISEQLSLVAQWQMQSQTFDSALDTLGSSSSQLTVGLQSPRKNHWSWTLYFTEDTDVNSAPDFGAGLEIRYAR